MGDYVLMKTLLLTLIFVSGTLFANANTDWVDKQVQAIKPPRTGVSHAAINRVKNPFIFVYKKTDGSKTAASKTAKKVVDPKKAAQVAAKKGPLKLAAIMNNSALINGSWYQVNDKVRGYTLSKIETDAVLLKRAKTKKMLFITEENPNIKIQVK
jgi:hypothetical protein